MLDSGTILCVDDDTTVLSALRTLLGHAFGTGFPIEFAESGEEALEILSDLEQAGQHLSIIISDFIMPGMRGDELLIQMHARSPKTITIMLTGQSDFEGVKKAINQANLYRFLEKPFNHDDIVLTVKSAVQAYQHEEILVEQNRQLRGLNTDLEVMLRKVQESERLLEERVAQRTHELDEKNQALQQALRSLEDVERIARHDLKTPLVSISAAPGLLRAGRSVSQQEEEILCMIESASSRALSMVNLSLDLFCMESGSYVFRPTRVDLCAIVSSVAMGLAGHARSKSVIISVPEDPAHAYVEAEDSLCYSIIGNLIKNAVEAAPEHSVISISLIAGPKVQLNIHNQGAVPGALRASFFEKYSTSGKVGGTGLGTYSSHLLARVQGGSLQMQTSDEDGTTLSLVLNASMPVSGHITQGSIAQHSTAQIVTSSAKPQSNQPTGLHVLFVDDDDFSHMVMGEYVPQPRFSLDSAINGRMALDCVTARRPDLIIMDIEMPVMGGVEALEKIRAHQISTQQKPSYIVAYSGNDDALSRDRYRELGFDECLPKPGAREDVERLLNSLAILVSN